ncbi:MAG: serine/threonine protein kinase [Planctomycetaceae bacterium]|nr:serine/threonine protein kinase [Planctomycetaceae bacterium]MCB9949594.1 serine/threonine protein kinase [Planctomycetaceae bacterium]
MGFENSENLIDDFELVNCIATGNTTQVWEVKHISNGQTYAMKLLLTEAMQDADAKRSLKHEAAVGKSLTHPNIIQVFDLKMAKKFGYFTMEHFRAPNLKSYLRNELPVAQARTKRLMESLAQALAHVHDKGWVHRDIKPDNVLVSKGGEFRLIDFSLCSKPSNSILHALTRKSAITIQGTRTYLAPELIQRKPLTFAADMYSLGIMFFELLTGFPPFRTGNPNDLLMMHIRDVPDVPSSFNPNVTPEVDALVMRMIAKDPKKRPESMQSLFSELSKIQCFKENPETVAAKAVEKERDNELQSVDKRIDSRADAERSAAGVEAPKAESTKEKVRFRLGRDDDGDSATKKASPAPAQSAPAQPPMPMPGMMPGQMPYMPMPGMMPGMPMPGMMPGMQMPGMPMPGMMPGQMPFMPGQMPGMPMPGMMPGQMPGMPMPGQAPAGGGVPMPPGMPQPGQQAPAAPPTSQQPVAPTPAPARKEEEEIPLASMDDLIIE